ncbi:MAG: methyltransferase domain-containing protein [Methanosarcinaceae archaeon]|nr:methyltransferase domain-containing protein [Methanosarcinaceae archaeon]MDF1533422.1 methyltransferase domain-containing protein [Methanosarcinaceae archaeon]
MENISRVTRSKKEAKISYDKMSRWYDILIGRGEKRSRESGLAVLDAREGEKVLEIGFGTGHVILALARSVGDSGEVHGLDISEGMLNITASRIEEEGLSHRVNLQCGDAANLPYTHGFFDAIFMSFTLELFDTPDIPIVLQECRRVLKDNGRIGVVSMSREGKTGTMMKLYELGHEKLPNYIDCRPIYAKNMLEDAGFTIANTEIMTYMGLPVEIILGKK